MFKNFYKFGMISLIFIPILCIPFFVLEYARNDLRFLKLNLPEPYYGNSFLFNYTTLDRIRKEVVFKEFNSQKSTNFDSIFKQFIKVKYDSTLLLTLPKNYQHGIKTKLNKNTKYKNLVAILNLCEKYKIERYALDLRYDEVYIYEILNEPKVFLLEVHDISL